MCYFITVAFPKTAANSIQTTLPKGLQSLAITNPAITKLLPKNYDSLSIITAMCSCDLYSPSKLGDKDREKEALRRRYMKKGWSESKIQRALDDHEKNVKVRLEGFRDDFLCWLTATAANSAASLFVFVHMYRGDIETEEFDVGRTKVKIGEFGLFRQNFPENVLVEIIN